MQANVMGQWLREQRKSKGFTQGEVATALGLSQPGYSNIERGNVKLSPAYINPLTALLGVSWAEIVDQALGMLTEVERAMLKDPKLSAADCRLLLLVYGDRTGRQSASLDRSTYQGEAQGDEKGV